MIDQAAKKTMEPARKLADRLCQQNDANAAFSNSGKVYVEWNSTMTVAKLLGLIGKKRAYVSLASPYVVAIFANSREEAHQIVGDELGY